MFENLENALRNLDKWLLADTGNYYGFLITSGVLIALAALVVAYFYRKIGKADERTEIIRAKIGNDTLIAFVIISVVFVASLSTGLVNIQQLYMPFLALACIVAAISSAVRYNSTK